MQPGADWPAKYPWRLLPRGGAHPYVPPQRGDWLKNPPRGDQDGYLDADGNELGGVPVVLRIVPNGSWPWLPPPNHAR